MNFCPYVHGQDRVRTINGSTAGNWSRKGIAAAPIAGDQLVFAGTTQTSTQNDLAAAKFQSIEFQGSNFTLSGNRISLAGSITVDAGATADTISLGIDLSGATANVGVADSGSSLTIAGTLSGKGGLTKTGDGTLTLGGTNSYGGVTRISAGTLLAGESLCARTCRTNTIGASAKYARDAAAPLRPRSRCRQREDLWRGAESRREARCFLQRDAANAILRRHESLHRMCPDRAFQKWRLADALVGKASIMVRRRGAS